MDIVFVWLWLIGLLLSGEGMLREVHQALGLPYGTESENQYERFKAKQSKHKKVSVSNRFIIASIVLLLMGLLNRSYNAVDYCSDVFTPSIIDGSSSPSQIEEREKYRTVANCISEYPYITVGDYYYADDYY
ncbi:hypothetical protein OAI26_02025 [Sulfitobacter sp.]|nr:hypothetical protein [Sulfitobacter sp.]